MDDAKGTNTQKLLFYGKKLIKSLKQKFIKVYFFEKTCKQRRAFSILKKCVDFKQNFRISLHNSSLFLILKKYQFKKSREVFMLHF